MWLNTYKSWLKLRFFETNLGKAKTLILPIPSSVCFLYVLVYAKCTLECITKLKFLLFDPIDSRCIYYLY
jgi:hypothetical protein